MDKTQKEKLIKHISKMELLKSHSKLMRIFINPIKTIPYYFLMLLSHRKPFLINSTLPWGDRLKGYLPECGTFYYFGYCEANLASFIVKNIKKDSICLDVGAHVGYYTLLFSKIVGENGKVFSFEPTSWTFNVLKQNTSNLRNVEINNIALSDESGLADFTDYGPGYGAYNTATKSGSSVLKIKTSSYKITTDTIDNFCLSKNIIPSFIKLDAEGFESKILSGALEVIKNSRPVISLEIADSNNWTENHNESLRLTQGMEYSPFKINNDGTLERFNKSADTKYDNIILLPNEKIEYYK